MKIKELKQNQNFTKKLLAKYTLNSPTPPSPAKNNYTTTGTGTKGDVVLTGFLQLFLFFKDEVNEEVLLSLRFRNDVQDEADVFLPPYVTIKNVMVGVHICGDDRDECSVCVITMENFFE